MAATAELSELVLRIRADTAQLDRGMQAANDNVRRTAGQMEKSFGGLKAQILGIVGTFASTAYLKGIIDYGDHLYTLSRQTGVSVEALSELDYAARLSGTTLEAVAQTLRVMGRNISDAANNTGPAKQALKDLHLNAKELVGLSLDQQMLAVAGAMQQVGKDADYMAIGMDIAGRGFGDVAPLFREGANGIRALREEARQLGITMSTETAESFNGINDEIDTMKMRADALARTLLENLIPAITDVTTGLTQLLNKAKNTSTTFNVLGGAFAVGGIGIKQSFTAFKSWLQHGRITDEAQQQINDLQELKQNVLDVGAENIAEGQDATAQAEGARRKFKQIAGGGISRTDPDALKKQQDINKTITDYIQKLHEQREMVGLSESAQAGLAAKYELINQLMSKGLTLKQAEAKIGPERLKQIEAEAIETEKIKKAYEDAQRAADEMQRSISEGLTKLAFDFKSAGQAAGDFFKTLAQEIFKVKIADPLSKSIMGALDLSGVGKWLFGFSGLSGARASGGPVSQGGAYLVGENGPEIFRPNMPGTIIPNGAGGGGASVTLVQNINVSPGVPELIAASLRQAAPSIAKAGRDMVVSELQSGGGLAKLVR